jgi:hypothetical protein
VQEEGRDDEETGSTHIKYEGTDTVHTHLREYRGYARLVMHGRAQHARGYKYSPKLCQSAIHVRTHIHTYTHTLSLSVTQTYAHTCVHIHTCTNVYTYVHTHTHTHTHTRVHIHSTDYRPHTLTHAHTHPTQRTVGGRTKVRKMCFQEWLRADGPTRSWLVFNSHAFAHAFFHRSASLWGRQSC